MYGMWWAPYECPDGLAPVLARILQSADCGCSAAVLHCCTCRVIRLFPPMHDPLARTRRLPRAPQMLCRYPQLPTLSGTRCPFCLKHFNQKSDAWRHLQHNCSIAQACKYQARPGADFSYFLPTGGVAGAAGAWLQPTINYVLQTAEALRAGGGGSGGGCIDLGDWLPKFHGALAAAIERAAAGVRPQVHELQVGG